MVEETGASLTTTAREPKVTTGQLAEWRATGYPYKLIAAAIAEWADGKERATVLPPNEFFGIEASDATYKRAKTFLVAQGVLSTNDGPFQVALSRFPRDLDPRHGQAGRGVLAAMTGLRQGAPWEQFCEAVCELIECGLLRPDQLLPSVRKAAVLWSMPEHAALRAYNALEREGVIEQCHWCGMWAVTPMPLSVRH